ncbi:MAG: alpha/beta hydrolase [Hylemonella sp.]|nr:alpha/beta hydrolase [Hylemonella sp.]
MSSTPAAGIDYTESGHGPTVLFVPGSYSTPAAWKPIQRMLPPQWRFVATSLCGYGQTAETRRAGDADMSHELRVLEAVARRVPGPVHLVGHSFGGTVALAGALSGRIEVASLALFEANPLALLHHHGHADLHAATRRMSHAFEQAVAYAEHDAPGRIIDFWGGTGSFAAMPPAVQDYCRQSAAANVLDWRTDFGYDFSGADLARLTMPMLLVRGEQANPAMVAMTQALAAHLPQARAAVVAGASHFLISTHPQECAALLAAHLAPQAQGAGRSAP